MKAVIDWFNGKGRAFDADGKAVTAYWTTGATAMIGTSYVGTLPIGAARLGVDGLKAIVPDRRRLELLRPSAIVRPRHQLLSR